MKLMIIAILSFPFLYCTLVSAESVTLSETTFIVPSNDGEAKQIIKLLNKVGAKDIRISNQTWGARLDKEPVQNLHDLKKSVVIVEMPSPQLEKDLIDKGHQVFVIDHHDYDHIKRSKSISALEQISDLLNHPLDRFEMGIAINDRSYIPGLLEAGYSQDEILAIREFDLLAQGLNTDEIRLNRNAYINRIKSNNLTIIHAETSRVSLIADLHALEEPSHVRDLLIISHDKNRIITEINFYGNPKRAQVLHSKLGGWSGGDQTRSMFWGKSENISLIEIEKLLNASVSIRASCFKFALGTLSKH